MNLIFFLLVLYSFIARLLNWLSIWQQKEYRLDRLFAFLKTTEGRHQLSKIINFPLTKSTLRRPRFTLKAISIIIGVLIIFLILNPVSTINLLGFYLFLPLHVIIASIPAWIATFYFTKRYQSQTKGLIARHQPTIIGITGSYGKTTTKILLSQLLRAKHKLWFSPKSYNTPFSLPATFVKTYRGQPLVIVEYAAYKRGEIARLTNIFPPNLAIITGITLQHHAVFGSLDNIIKAKSELLNALGPGSKIIYNSADKTVTQMIKPYFKQHLSPSIKAIIKNPHLTSKGQLTFSLGSTKVHTQLVGLHYINNIKLAITLAKDWGVTNQQIKTQLEAFKPTSEFVSITTTKSGITIINDPKTTNPKGFTAAIDLASHLKAKKKAIISAGIIDLGSSSASIHQQIATRSNKIFDYFFHTSLTGADQLKTTLKSKYYPVDTLNSLKHLVTRKLISNDLLLIEGRLRPEFTDYLHNL